MKKIIFLSCLIAIFASCTRKAVRNAAEIKIMSFNLRYNDPADGINDWDHRKAACAAMIDSLKPAVVGLQEALIDQIGYLDSVLTDYCWIGKGRDSSGESNEYAAVFYRNGDFELLDFGTFWLSETPDIESRGWDAKYKRVATWVYLKNKNNSKPLLMLNTHLDHKGPQARLESVKLLVGRLKKMGGDTLTVFATGDFNARPKHELFVPIKAYMADTRLNAPETDLTGTTNGYGSEPEGKIIDYIFYRNATPLSYRVITGDYGVPYISDHYPILGTFNY